MPPNRNHVYKVKQGKHVGKNQSKYPHNWPQHDDCFIQRCVVVFTSQELSKKDTNDCKKRVWIEDDTHDDNIEGMCGYIFKANMLQFFFYFLLELFTLLLLFRISLLRLKAHNTNEKMTTSAWKCKHITRPIPPVHTRRIPRNIPQRKTSPPPMVPEGKPPETWIMAK